MLDEILVHKRKQLGQIDQKSKIEKMMLEVSALPSVRSLGSSLSNDREISLIAEIKRRSPSKGILARNLDAASTAILYEGAGACAISVLTESEYFGGSTEDLKAVAAAVSIPVLRKDFILEEFQIWESRVLGADAILLIASILSAEKLAELHALAGQVGLEALVEVHSEKELGNVFGINPEIIGVNNRNLRTFDIDLAVTEKLAPQIPAEIVRVSESGINDRKDMLRLQKAGVDAVLVGEKIVTSSDPYTKIRKLLGKVDD